MYVFHGIGLDVAFYVTEQKHYRRHQFILPRLVLFKALLTYACTRARERASGQFQTGSCNMETSEINLCDTEN